MRALVDGDVIVYAAGFASDKNTYTTPDHVPHRYKREATAHCKKYGLDPSKIVKGVQAEPLEHCLHSVKKMLNDIKNKIDATEVEVFLSGPGNYRDDMYKFYKANRDPSHKPIHYNEIKEYLRTVWKAQEVTGVEADDAMGWWQYREVVSQPDVMMQETCICTIDKDLNMIPGWHYNWKADKGKGMMYPVSETEATLYFFKQWLTGDSADNIPGLGGIGDVTAERMLRSFGSTDPGPLYEYVCEQYHKRGISTGTLNTIGDLLWIQRSPMEMWDKHFGIRRHNE